MRRALPATLAHPVTLSVAAAAGLQLLWLLLLADAGGDIAAQDAWADFARDHPGRTYNFAWYGGIHVVSYSVLSPTVMAAVGVRTTLMVAATVSAGLLAWLVVRTSAVRHPVVPGLLGALALFGNSISGRTTFALGMPFAIAAVLVVCTWPDRWRGVAGWRQWARGALAAVLSLVATLGSPVDGLFLGLIAAGLWLNGRRSAAYTLGVPPVLVVVTSAILFPLDGVQPMPWSSAILPVALALLAYATAPPDWRLLRTTALVYAAAVIAVWVVPSPIGTNVTRLALLFAPATFASILLRSTLLRRREAESRRPAHRIHMKGLAAVLALVAGLGWQVAGAVHDGVRTTPDEAWEASTSTVTERLRALGATDTRIEVVPTASHREASAFSSSFVLARGWNRQLDLRLNQRFYDEEEPLTHAEYRRWLHEWAVTYVVLPPGRPDEGALTERDLLADAPGYLEPVWRDGEWAIFAVRRPTPVVNNGGDVLAWDSGGITIRVPREGSYLIREKHSERMVLRDSDGDPVESPETLADNEHGCLDQQPVPEEEEPGWTILRAPHPGVYRISSDVTSDTACPEE